MVTHAQNTPNTPLNSDLPNIFMVEVLKVVLPGWIIDRRPYRHIEDMMVSHSALVEHGRDGALHRTRFLSFPIKADTPARHYQSYMRVDATSKSGLC